MNNHPASAYQQSSARGASPVGLIVLLYDTILRDLRRAMTAFESGQIEVRVFELNHALTVVGYLQSIIDSEQGGDAAQLLHHFYGMIRPMIVELNASPSVPDFQTLIDLITPVRQAWDQARQRYLMLLHAKPPPKSRSRCYLRLASTRGENLELASPSVGGGVDGRFAA